MNRQIYQRLKLALTLNLRRQLFIAVCDDLALQTQLAIALQAEFDRLSDRPYLKTRRTSTTPKPYPSLVSLQLNLADPDPMAQVAQWLQQHPPPLVGGRQLQIPNFQVMGIEHLTRETATIQWQFLGYLQAIEQHLSMLEASLLFWMPRPWLHSIQQSAPEFWNWHTAVFEFVGDPTPVEVAPTLDKLASVTTSIASEAEPASEDIWEILAQDLARFGENQDHPTEQTPNSAESATPKPRVPQTASQRQPNQPPKTAARPPRQPASPSRASAARVPQPPTLPVKQQTAATPIPVLQAATDSSQAEETAQEPVTQPSTLSASPQQLPQPASPPSTAIPAADAIALQQPALTEPVKTLQHIHQLHQQQAAPAELAAAYRMLGNLYRDRIEAGDGSEQNLTLAIQAYDKVIEWLNQVPETRPGVMQLSHTAASTNGYHAGTQSAALSTVNSTTRVLNQSLPGSPQLPAVADVLNDLGNLYWMLSRSMSDLQERLPKLLQSIQTYQAALAKVHPETQPTSYAMIQNNLGAAYGDLARHQDTANNLQRSITAYQAALCYRKPEVDSAKYASTQNNLGTAYWHLAQYQQPASNLQRAIAAYTDALQYYRPEQEPLNYAMIQNNLGTAYWNLAQYEKPDELLELAVQAYHQALIYRTAEALPTAHAATQNNLGTAYWHLANRQKQHPQTKYDYLTLAIQAYTAALQTAANLTTPLTFDVFATQNNLGLAHFQTATDKAFPLDQSARSTHLEAALEHHLKAAEGWQHQPDFYKTALNYVIQTLRAFYSELGLKGQNLALSKIPGQLLGEILPKL